MTSLKYDLLIKVPLLLGSGNGHLPILLFSRKSQRDDMVLGCAHVWCWVGLSLSHNIVNALVFINNAIEQLQSGKWMWHRNHHDMTVQHMRHSVFFFNILKTIYIWNKDNCFDKISPNKISKSMGKKMWISYRMKRKPFVVYL